MANFEDEMGENEPLQSDRQLTPYTQSPQSQSSARRLSSHGRSSHSLYSSSSNDSPKHSLTSPKGASHTNRSSVRYVNSAAFIENEESNDEVSIAESLSARKCETHRVEQENDAEEEEGIVPPLDLQSVADQTSQREFTFSYRKHYMPMKVKPEEAYQTWLSAKRRVISDQVARRKQAQDEKRRKEEERRQIADRKYQEWLAKKARNAARSQSKAEAAAAAVAPKEPPELKEEVHPKMTDEEARAKLEEWNRRKAAEIEKRRLLKQREEELRRAYEEQRRQDAEEAWKGWLAKAAHKPKPVPLNRGVDTMRGTISNIYVNPNEWKGVLGDERPDDQY